MIGADEMPEDNADLAAVEIELPRLADDSPASCPVTLDRLLRYLADEVPDGEALTGSDLTFLRTAQVDATRYWIWRFDEPPGDGASATVAIAPNGAQTIGYDVDRYRLTPEQFLLGDHHRVV